MSELKAAPHLELRIATYNIHRCRGMDRRTAPQRIAEVLRDIDADVVALQEVIGAGPAGAGQAEEIGAALGMGWVMTSVRHLRRHLFGNVDPQPLPDRAPQPVRPVVADVRAARLPARRSRSRAGPRPARLQRPSRHRGARAPLPGAAPRLLRPRSPRSRGPKIILGDFNEWMRGLATKTLSSLFESIDIHSHLKRRRTYPGHLPRRPPRSHLLRGRRRGAQRGAAAQPQGADGVRPPAARRQPAHRLQVAAGARGSDRTSPDKRLALGACTREPSRTRDSPDVLTRQISM